MSSSDTLQEAIEILQQLGLAEYEARCFVGLTRLSRATAKQLSDVTEVPRTRVYDAVRVLEAKGLVQVHHSSPQQFQAVDLAEATATLRDEYEDRVETLQNALQSVEPLDDETEGPVQEVWSMSGTTAIENRANALMDEAESEVILVVGEDDLLTDALIESLSTLASDVDVAVGVTTSATREALAESLPGATIFLTDLDWLREEDGGQSVTIGRLLLVDRSSILVSTFLPSSGEENALYGTGFGNGLVVITRRLLGQGLLPGLERAAAGTD